MKLYHGSNIEVINPEIRPKLRNLDFGAGFYTTLNESQAAEFAVKVVRRVKLYEQKSGKAIVSEYDFDFDAAKGLMVLRFKKPDEEWLDFVVANRKGGEPNKEYDIVMGPVANDNVYEVINLYQQGRYTKREALERFKVKELFSQITFKTDKAIKLLKFIKSTIIK